MDTIEDLMTSTLLRRNDAPRTEAIVRTCTAGVIWTDHERVVSGFGVAIVRDGLIAELYTVITKVPR